jgi:hypothetical protein
MSHITETHRLGTRIFGPEREEVTAIYGKRCNDKPHDCTPHQILLG